MVMVKRSKMMIVVVLVLVRPVVPVVSVSFAEALVVEDARFFDDVVIPSVSQRMVERRRFTRAAAAATGRCRRR